MMVYGLYRMVHWLKKKSTVFTIRILSEQNFEKVSVFFFQFYKVLLLTPSLPYLLIDTALFLLLSQNVHLKKPSQSPKNYIFMYLMVNGLTEMVYCLKENSVVFTIIWVTILRDKNEFFQFSLLSPFRLHQTVICS